MRNFALFFFTFCTLAVFAQTKSIHTSPVLREAAPESVGISDERLERIDKMCRESS